MPDLLPFVLRVRSFAKSFSWASSSNMRSVHTLGLLSHIPRSQGSLQPVSGRVGQNLGKDVDS